MNTLRPFNLEEAKAGKPIVCRDGEEANFLIHSDLLERNQRVVFARAGDVYACNENGKNKLNSLPDRFDLFMAPEKRTVWVNFYPDECHGQAGVSLFSSKEEADKRASNQTRIACVEVTFTEGQGL